MGSTVITGCNAPQATHVLMGVVKLPDGSHGDINVEVSDLSLAELAVYEEFFALVDTCGLLCIENSPEMFDLSHVTPIDANTEFGSIDYSSLGSDQAKVDDFILLIQSLAQ